MTTLADRQAAAVSALHQREINVMTAKRHDYAADDDIFSNFEFVGHILNVAVKAGVEGRYLDCIALIATKLARLIELLGGKEPVHEALEDTCIDGANYFTILGAMWMVDRQRDGEEADESDYEPTVVEAARSHRRNMEHAPAPWKGHYHGMGKEIGIYSEPEDGARTLVAVLGNNEFKDANLDLIVKAPGLLKAVSELLEYMDGVNDDLLWAQNITRDTAVVEDFDTTYIENLREALREETCE